MGVRSVSADTISVVRPLQQTSAAFADKTLFWASSDHLGASQVRVPHECLAPCLSVEYVSEQEQLVGVFGDGTILGAPLDIQGQLSSVHVIGEVAGSELLVVSWSPDRDLCALLGDGPSLLMLSAEEWMMEAQAPKLQSGKPVSACWRGDGQMIAVRTLGDESPLVIFSRDAEMLAKASIEAEEVLGRCIAWKPSGELIAAVNTHAKKVVFFEPNGLRHGDFPLNRDFEVNVDVGLSWNADSDILAVWNKTLVHLYVRENYRWYLKQSLNLPGEEQGNSFVGLGFSCNFSCQLCLEFGKGSSGLSCWR